MSPPYSASFCVFCMCILGPFPAYAATNPAPLNLYGQVHKALVALDDGQSTEFAVVDNSVASTRIGLKGQKDINSAFTASFLLEMQVQDNPGFLMTQNTTVGSSPTPVNQNSPASFQTRHARVGLGIPFGTFFLGRQSMATDGVAEQDLAGVGYMMYSLTTDLAAGYRYRDLAGNLQESIGTLSTNLDGVRANAVGFHTIKCNGLQGRFSVAQGGDADAALFYSKSLKDVTLRAAGGLQWQNDASSAATNTVDYTLSGSVSARHTSGLGVTLAAGRQTLQNAVSGAQSPQFGYVKLGYSQEGYAFAVDYSQSDDIERDNVSDESAVFGLGGQLNLTQSTVLTGMYRQFSAQKAGQDYEPINLFALGMLVRF